MAVFDVSFLNPKLRKSTQDYGFMVDSLKIKENQLKGDDKLSSGDSNLLIQDYKNLYSHPGLSADNRSKILVEISSLESNKKRNKIKDLADISRINGEYDNDIKETIYAGGNSPAGFLYGKMAALESKLFRLKDSVRQLEDAGNDSSYQTMELQKVLNKWLDVKQASAIAENYKEGQVPQSDFSVYITTNSKGQIRDIDIRRTEPKSGFYETNGILGGFPIYGKMNEKTPEGKAVFKLGNEKFSAPDYYRMGPDGTFQQAKLVAESQLIRGKRIKRAKSEYYDVNPGNILIENSSSAGDWIQGKDSFYKDLGNGTYEKYLGASKEDLRIDEQSLLTTLPDSVMRSVNERVIKTNDWSQQFQPPMNINVSSPVCPVPVTPTTMPFAAPTGLQESKAPVERSPQTFGGYAAATIGKAKSFLGRLFGSKE